MYIFKNISELCTISCSDPARKAKFCHPTTYLRRNETRSPKWKLALQIFHQNEKHKNVSKPEKISTKEVNAG